ncbi:hypothetical protein BJX64DRAFT_291552 [Aspergillus heterothallicus]
MNRIRRNANRRPLPHPCPPKEGFANVARWIALDRDSETFIYRGFRELAARNLLYLQSELLDLEKRLNELDKNDATTDDLDVKDEARTWETLRERYESGNEDAKARMDLVMQLRASIKEYHETLLLQSDIVKLDRPDGRVLDTYKHWFQKPHPALGGVAKTALDDAEDLVVLKSLPEGDYLSSLLRRHWPTTSELSRDGLNRIGRFNEKSISIAVAAISISVASFLLIGSIVGLYLVKDDAVKLALIAAFTAVFALSVGLMTNARRAEIFAATAAYAAVLVVFVSGEISSPQRAAT